MSVLDHPHEVRVREHHEHAVYYRIAAGEQVTVRVQGKVLQLTLRQAWHHRRHRSPAQIELTVERAGGQALTAQVDFSHADGGRGRGMRGWALSRAVVRQISLPPGQLTYRIHVQAPRHVLVVLRPEVVATANPQWLIAPPTPPAPALARAPTPPPTPAAAPQASMVTTGAEQAALGSGGGATTAATSHASPAKQTGPGAVSSEGETVTREQSDQSAQGDSKSRGGSTPPQTTSNKSPKAEVSLPPIEAKSDSVAAATQALANAVAKGYAALHRSEPFHRIAIPYFESVGKAAKKDHLGRLVAELLAVQLSHRKPFVVVERERLNEIMREHRLTGLGIVDKATAAEFGKVLGAQSLISGTVADAGPKFEVTVRQVEVETGKVLVAGHVEIDRGGLIALSSDAVVKRSRTGALFRSALVPGWGQFYNGDILKSVLFFAGGLGTAGTALGFYLASNKAAAKYHKDRPKTVGQRAVANNDIRIVNDLLISYAAVWVVNMVDAFISGKNFTKVEVSSDSLGPPADAMAPGGP